MTLRDRCEALVREWLGEANELRRNGDLMSDDRPAYLLAKQIDERADALKAALDATAGEAAVRVTGEGAMFGRMDSADFSADTLTFTMEPGYYAAAGRYLIVPVPAIDQAMKESKP
jgi:hypothetical protein